MSGSDDAVYYGVLNETCVFYNGFIKNLAFVLLKSRICVRDSRIRPRDSRPRDFVGEISWANARIKLEVLNAP